MILFSGHDEEDAPHTEGEALMLISLEGTYNMGITWAKDFESCI